MCIPSVMHESTAKVIMCNGVRMLAENDLPSLHRTQHGGVYCLLFMLSCRNCELEIALICVKCTDLKRAVQNMIECYCRQAKMGMPVTARYNLHSELVVDWHTIYLIGGGHLSSNACSCKTPAQVSSSTLAVLEHA